MRTPQLRRETGSRGQTPTLAAVRARLAGLPAERLSPVLVSECCYYPTRFPVRQGLQHREYPRRPRLHLPFSSADFDGAAFLDDLDMWGLILPRG